MEVIEKLLDASLKIGLSEFDFWEMTIGEVDRFIESYNWRKSQQEKQNAFLVYSTANLIGMKMADVLNGTNNMPEVYDVFPDIFPEEQAKREEEEQNRKEEETRLKFLQFATHFNNKLKGGEINNGE